MPDFNGLLDAAVSRTGLQGMALLVTLMLVSMICQLITRFIPDNATGALGIVRKVTRFIGLYAHNRIAPGVTTIEAIHDVGRLAARADKKAEAVQDTVADAAVVTRDPKTGQFQKARSPIAVSIVALGLLLLCACTTTQIRNTTDAFCASASTAQTFLDRARANEDPGKAQRLLARINATCPLILLELDLTDTERQSIAH